MDAITLKQKLVEWTVANSGYEERHYLGMSQIAECPRKLARELVHGRRWSTEQHLQCYNGYLFEADVKSRLVGLGLYVPGSERELVAEFDSRYIGHTDGEVDGALLEIKSTTVDGLARIERENRVSKRNYWQVQTYMRHGAYAQAVVVFVARDTGELYTHTVRPVSAIMDMLDERAKFVLAAVDAGELPLCECGRCS